MRYILCLFLLAASASGQVDSGQTFKSGVTLIQAPVTVRDHDGHVVSDLTKDDFQLFDNGKKLEIVSFAVENPAAQAAPDRSLASPGSPPAQPATAPAVDVPARFIAYFFDDLGMSNIIEIREAALKQIDALEPGDRAGIFTSSSCKGLVDFTNDKQRLRQALERLQPAAIPLCRVAQTQKLQVELLKAIVGRMANLPGRRDIILVSSGFYVGHDRSDEESALIDAAVRSKVAINALDAGGGPGVSRSFGSDMAAERQRMEQPLPVNGSNPLILTELAHGTGGTYVTGNDFDLSFRRLATPDSYYVLGFAPPASDGRFHKLKVQLRNGRKLTVDARAGYYAPKTAE